MSAALTALEPRSRREREVEAAWRHHEPLRARVPLAARRAATAFREGLAGDAEKIKRTYASPEFRRVLNDWAAKKNVGRAVALHKIKKMIAPAIVEDTGDALLITWLQPHAGFVQVDMPTFKQPGVVVVATHVARVRKNIRETGFPAAEIPDHALARMYQRCPDINAKEALREAALAFLHADRESVRTRTVCLPCADGLLLCLPIEGPDMEGKTRLVARANTFIAAGQAELDQRPVAKPTDPAATVLTAAVFVR